MTIVEAVIMEEGDEEETEKEGDVAIERGNEEETEKKGDVTIERR